MRPDTPAADHTDTPPRTSTTPPKPNAWSGPPACYPEDAEALLLQAGGPPGTGRRPRRATTLYDRLLPPPPRPRWRTRTWCGRSRPPNLWEYGHEAEARAIIDGVRAAAPADPAPWVIVAEALEAHDELDAAHETFTEAVSLPR